MKAKLLFLIGFFACQTIFAQNNPGIAVQGIARDAERAAIVDELLTFTFEIRDPAEGLSHYKENVTIKTDPYGVFSHIIGTGSNPVGKFNEIPFGQAHMSLLITVDYDNNIVEVSNGPFQYAPYAKSAENGVPTGTIVAFAGQEKDIPRGWVLCDGRSLHNVPDSKNLIALIGIMSLISKACSYEAPAPAPSMGRTARHWGKRRRMLLNTMISTVLRVRMVITLMILASIG